MLFYTRLDFEDLTLVKELSELTISSTSVAQQSTLERKKKMMGCSKLKMPLPIERSIQKQNVRFLHHRNQYTSEYFQFMRKLINCNAQFVAPASANSDKLTPEAEDLALITVQLASKFLFNSGFHTKKTLRGPAQEWYEAITQHLRFSRTVRNWFCQKVLFAQPTRFCEYILECPTAEVRTAFVRIIVFVAHYSLNDGPAPVPAILQQPNQVSILAEKFLGAIFIKILSRNYGQ
jgi:ubiquitin carboxyl-terminal hydrolase 9/24